MNERTAVDERPRNPFRDPARSPDWAQLTRLAGDRAAILFEHLRAQVGSIDGLIEDLHYAGPEVGWTPRYRLGETTLFIAHIFPGMLEASIEVDSSACEKLLASPKTGAAFKAALRRARTKGQPRMVRVPLPTRDDIRTFAREVRRKGKIVATPSSLQTRGH